jgi:hypothetical protein
MLRYGVVNQRPLLTLQGSWDSEQFAVFSWRLAVFSDLKRIRRELGGPLGPSGWGRDGEIIHHKRGISYAGTNVWRGRHLKIVRLSAVQNG